MTLFIRIFLVKRLFYPSFLPNRILSISFEMERIPFHCGELNLNEIVSSLFHLEMEIINFMVKILFCFI
jgi:hypothetical protein